MYRKDMNYKITTKIKIYTIQSVLIIIILIISIYYLLLQFSYTLYFKILKYISKSETMR